MKTVEGLPENGVIAILRRVPQDRLTGVVRALQRAGVRAVECTFDQADPQGEARLCDALDLLTHTFGADMAIGAGTVLTCRQAELAAGHGARFLVSPNTDEAVIRRTRALGLYSFPGALTPTEAVTAYNAGATAVKLFPAASLGPGYLKALCAPLAHIPFLAVGGIGPENVTAFRDAGACGFGIGGPMIPPDAGARGDEEAIFQKAHAVLDALEKRS